MQNCKSLIASCCVAALQAEIRCIVKQVVFLQIDKICHTFATHGIVHERRSAAPIHKVGSFEIARGVSKSSTACRLCWTWHWPSAGCYR